MFDTAIAKARARCMNHSLCDSLLEGTVNKLRETSHTYNCLKAFLIELQVHGEGYHSMDFLFEVEDKCSHLHTDERDLDLMTNAINLLSQCTPTR